jgi:hypothetical protein
MAYNNSSSPNGFDRDSTAPAFIARTEEGMSPWPVIKTIGGASPPGQFSLKL